MRRAFALLIRSGVWLAVIAGVLAWLVPVLWVCDASSGSEARALVGFGVLLLEVFAFHGGLALLAIVPVALLARCRLGALALLVLVAVHSGPGLVSSFRSPPQSVVSDAPVLTVLSHNLLFSSASLDSLAEHVEAEMPDVIMLQEVVGRHAQQIFDRFGGDYPYCAWPNTHKWGGMLLSKTPFLETPPPVPGQAGWRIDQPVGMVEFAGGPVTMVGIHLPAPNSLDQLVAGPQMSARLAAWIADQRAADPETAMVLAGDFNAPLWTTRMAPLREAGLVRAHDTAGQGRGGTWPAHRGLGSLPGIRLDQAASVGPLRCIESRVLSATGSDHRPILARYLRSSGGGAGRLTP